MLTPQQVASFRTSAGLSPTPPPAANTGASSVINARKEALGLNTPPTPTTPSTPSVSDNYFSDSGVGAAAKDVMGGGNVGAAAGDLASGHIASGIEKGTLGVASDAVKAIFAPLSAPIQTLLQHFPNLTADNPNYAATPAVQAARQQIGDWAKAHPNQAQALSDAFTVGTAIAGTSGEGGLNTSVSDAATGVKNAVTDTVAGVKNTVKNVVGAVLPAGEDEATTIQNMIAPKLTPTETKLALAQGRIVSGEGPTLLRGGTPDEILPSSQTVQAAETIQAEIPGAAQMKPPELYSALDSKISETASALRPEMEATPITEETVSKIDSSWKALKTQQIADANATDEANVLKWQTQFEKYLQKSGSDNLGDLWDARISYDDSIPDRVKSANINSPENLQTQKEIWLQNRRILNTAINDSQTGMGATSQDAFGNMNDMYNAQKGISSSFKVTKVGAPSLLKQGVNAIKEHPVVSTVGALEGGKRILTGHF